VRVAVLGVFTSGIHRHTPPQVELVRLEHGSGPGRLAGVGARCWGSETSHVPGACDGCARVRGAQVPGHTCPAVVSAGWGGVGLLFEMWIVDASIFTTMR